MERFSRSKNEANPKYIRTGFTPNMPPLFIIYHRARLLVSALFFQLFLAIRSILKWELPHFVSKSPRRIPVFELIDMVADTQSLNSSTLVKYTDKHVGFSLRNSFIVITDIVNSTGLYNDNPRKMNKKIKIHDDLISKLVKKYTGHIVSNEGDSFGLAFEFINNAIGFCTEFLNELEMERVGLDVRVGINTGVMHVRNLYGYKCFGQPVNELSRLIRHSQGGRICIKEEHIAGYKLEPAKIFCIHQRCLKVLMDKI